MSYRNLTDKNISVLSLHLKTLKALITTAADDILILFFFYIWQKIKLDCEILSSKSNFL